MKTENEIIDMLIELYQKQGYVTEQSVFDLCDNNSLSFIATDRVCNKLLSSGVMFNDEENKENDVELEARDYSQIDYNIVYDFFLENYPGMKSVIDFVRRVGALQKGENNELMKQMRSGNMFARKKMIEKNMRTPLRLTMNYNNKTNIPLDELFSVACEGLITAVDSYDPYSNNHFTSYASLWIKQKIDRYIMDTQYLIRIPVHAYPRFTAVKQIMDNNEYSKDKIENILYNELGILDYEAKEWIKIVFSLDLLDIDDLAENDKFCYDMTDDLVELAYMKMKAEIVDDILNCLSQKEKQIIEMRYGYPNGEIFTFDEIGKIYNVTKSRIQQIEKKALRKIKIRIKRTELFNEYADCYEE